MILPLAEWRPDETDLTSPYATVASGVYAAPNGYRPFPGFNSSAVMTGLTARCQGAAGFISTKDGGAYTFAGDQTKLYQNVNGAPSNISNGTYACPADENWEFAQFAGDMIALNITDPIQFAAMDAATVTVAAFVTSTLVPRARHIAVVGNQVMIGNTVESSVDYENRVRWSAVDDGSDFDESQTTLADHQDIEGVGSVKKVVGGYQYALVLLDDGVARMNFVGTPDIYTRDMLAPGIGCMVSGSVAQLGRLVFFLSRVGFVMCDGQNITPIGTDKIDQWFFDTWDQDYAHRVSATTDVVRQLYIVSFPSAAGATGEGDTLLMFHIPTQKWTYASLAAEFIFTSRSPGVTLEGLNTHPLGGTNIDAMTISLDSPIWLGGEAVLSGFNTSHVLRNINGDNLAAVVETGVMQPVPGNRSLVNWGRPLADGGTLSMALAMRERLNDAETFATAESQNADGFCMFGSSNAGRYAKARLSIAAAGTWEHAEAIELDVSDMGMF